MAIKYKLVKKSTDPSHRDSPKKWYARTRSSAPLPVKAMSRAATRNTTLAPIELEAALDLLANFIPGQLLQGHTVRIPGLGYFRLTYKSRGSDTVKDFNPKEMIYDARPVFVPDKAFREAIRQGVEFEDGGVKQDGINYATRADYYKATGQAGDGEEGGSTTPGGQGGGEGTLG